MLIENLTPEETLALTKIADGACRELVEAGTHNVDVLVRLRGQIKVGEDHEAVIATAVPWEKVALHLLSKVNTDTRRKVIAAALEGASIADEIKDEAKAIAGELKDATKAMRKGAVRTELVIERAKPSLAVVDSNTGEVVAESVA